MTHPIDNIKWIHRDRIIPNDYNPNRMYPQEFELLITSILDDGWLFPILLHGDIDGEGELKLIDGFHRHKASGDKRIIERDKGMVPVLALNGRSYEEYMARTVRMNRAKGVHSVEGMSGIVKQMVDAGWESEKIMKEMGMEKEEVQRLALQEGIPASKLFSQEFSKSWIPEASD